MEKNATNGCQKTIKRKENKCLAMWEKTMNPYFTDLKYILLLVVVVVVVYLENLAKQL